MIFDGLDKFNYALAFLVNEVVLNATKPKPKKEQNMDHKPRLPPDHGPRGVREGLRQVLPGRGDQPEHLIIIIITTSIITTD